MNEQAEIQARNRYLVISLSRFAGIAVLMFGFYLLYGDQDIAPPPVGYVFILIGVLDFFFIPPMLAKRWSSNAQNNGGNGHE